MKHWGLGILILAGITLAFSTAANWSMVQHGQRRQAQMETLAADLPQPNREQAYISSDRCQSCHPDEHATWHQSYHRTMTQRALPENIAGRFDGSTVRSGGLDYRIFTQDDQVFAEMPHPDEMMYVMQGNKPLKPEDIPRIERPVVMTTGSHHYQTYWVESPTYEGLLQTLPLVYLIKDQRWIPREAAFMTPPETQRSLITQWNHHCIRCHSTGGNPGLNESTGMLETKVGELGIACEACHGPAEAHVAFYENPVRRYQQHLGGPRDATIVNPGKLDHKAASQTCGQCHGVYIMEDDYAMDYAREGAIYRPGKDLHRTRYYIQHPANESTQSRQDDLKQNRGFFRERWWDDGTILAGGREYTAMSVSKCYTQGSLSCLTCHTMHGDEPVDQLKPGYRGSAACIECHQEPQYTDLISEHTFHQPNSSGSDCLNCHMPHTSYALFGALRSHQIQSPQAASSIQHGVPNACNLCHLDQTLEWTQTHLTERYGHPIHSLESEDKTTSAALLWLLKGDAAQRVIAAWHMAWPPAQAASGDQWQAPFLAELLDDPYGVVRYVAGSQLASLPGYEDLAYDFLAPPADRSQAQQRVQNQWQPNASAHPGHTLQSDIGDLQRAKLQQFLAERNNRPVTIKE